MLLHPIFFIVLPISDITIFETVLLFKINNNRWSNGWVPAATKRVCGGRVHERMMQGTEQGENE